MQKGALMVWRFTSRSAEISAKVTPPMKHTIVVGNSPEDTAGP